MNGSKLTSISHNSLYTSLYGSRTLAIWAKKDNISTNPTRILWEESRLARKRMTQAQQQIDTKLLCNQCSFDKTLFQHKHQDTHSCPVFSTLMEVCDHLYTCPGIDATKVFKREIDEIKNIFEEKETAPDIQIQFQDVLILFDR